MGRYCGPVCRLCRREGEKLFLKGDRCFSNKCAIERREGQPGAHAKLRGRFTEFKVQLREKQKVKRMYGMLEKGFRALFHRAERRKGVTGDNLLVMLESRLDNAVYRAGFVTSRREGRQLVSHGHVLVNGRKVSIPSYLVTSGDVIRLKERSQKSPRVNECLTASEGRKTPEWIELDRVNFQATVKMDPTRQHVTHPLKEQLIVELYSK